MSGWLDEIGEQKFREKDVELVLKLLKLLKDSAGEDFTEEDKTRFLEKLDNAIYNVTELRKKVIEAL